MRSFRVFLFLAVSGVFQFGCKPSGVTQGGAQTQSASKGSIERYVSIEGNACAIDARDFPAEASELIKLNEGKPPPSDVKAQAQAQGGDINRKCTAEEVATIVAAERFLSKVAASGKSSNTNVAVCSVAYTVTGSTGFKTYGHIFGPDQGDVMRQLDEARERAQSKGCTFTMGADY